MSEAQLRDLGVHRDSAAFSPLEKLVIDYAVAMTAAPVNVPDAMFAELRRQFTDAQLVELTASIAWENYRSRFNRPLEVEAQGFSENAYCVLPAHPHRA